ncbi:ABC transporter substrate-binding protein [Litoribacillus peritrichatus]|uniref:Branched-chain amino acid ABC transporter substrate-binding protein n=1 Tax=Litoribacillus peritrichatus TaxID=718191 RepID=A0ABP7MGR0_9GAMM
MSKHGTIVALVIGVLVVGLGYFVFSKSASTVRTLGVITNFEGKNSQSSIDAFKSVKLAYEEFKQKHPNLNLEILSIDNSDDPQKSKSAYETLKNKSDFIMIITTSTAFLAIYDEVTKNADTLHMIVGPTTTVISDKDDNVIRNTVDMVAEQKSIATHFNNRNVNEVLVIQEREKNQKYTDAAFKVFSDAYKGTIKHSSFSAIDVDLTAPFQKLEEVGFENVYILAGGTPREVGILIQNIHKMNADVNTVTTPWVRGAFLIEAIGKYTDKVFIPGHVSTNNVAYQAYVKSFQNRYNYLPAYQAPLTYDAARVLLEAIYNTKETNSDALKKYILSNTYEGTTGRIQFNKFGDVDGGLFFYHIDGKDYVLGQ